MVWQSKLHTLGGAGDDGYLAAEFCGWLVEVIFCVLMMMLEGIENPGVRIQNLGGHLRAFLTIPIH